MQIQWSEESFIFKNYYLLLVGLIVLSAKQYYFLIAVFFWEVADPVKSIQKEFCSTAIFVCKNEIDFEFLTSNF